VIWDAKANVREEDFQDLVGGLSSFNGLAAKYFVVFVAIRRASLPRVFFLVCRLAFSVVLAMPNHAAICSPPPLGFLLPAQVTV
jgi:hypothetical protein